MYRSPAAPARWLLAGIILLATAACSLFALPGEANPPDAAPTPTPTHTPAASLPDEPASSTAEPQETCPAGPAEFGLQASHHFWTDTGMGDWVWQASGYLQLVLDADGQVTSTAAQTFTGSQSGSFTSGENSCAFEAPAEVHLTLAGECAKGVIRLEIWEDWQMGTYDWTCDDDSFQFELPTTMLPPSVHPVTYPLGDPAGYTVEIPFAGGGGAKTYTLVFEE